MDSLDDLMGSNLVDFVYSDPPWGEGNLKYWQTMNLKMNPGTLRRDVSLSSFLDRIFDVYLRYTKENALIFIEYGQRW